MSWDGMALLFVAQIWPSLLENITSFVYMVMGFGAGARKCRAENDPLLFICWYRSRVACLRLLRARRGGACNTAVAGRA